MKIVSFEQAERLAKIGFNLPVKKFYWRKTKEVDSLLSNMKGNWNSRENLNTNSAPEVHEALQWIRDEKGIPCGVTINVNLAHVFLGDYIYDFLKENKVETIGGFNSYPEAESTLLDEILKHLEEKQ